MGRSKEALLALSLAVSACTSQTTEPQKSWWNDYPLFPTIIFPTPDNAQKTQATLLPSERADRHERLIESTLEAKNLQLLLDCEDYDRVEEACSMVTNSDILISPIFENRDGSVKRNVSAGAVIENRNGYFIFVTTGHSVLKSGSKLKEIGLGTDYGSSQFGNVSIPIDKLVIKGLDVGCDIAVVGFRFNSTSFGDWKEANIDWGAQKENINKDSVFFAALHNERQRGLIYEQGYGVVAIPSSNWRVIKDCNWIGLNITADVGNSGTMIADVSSGKVIGHIAAVANSPYQTTDVNSERVFVQLYGGFKPLYDEVKSILTRLPERKWIDTNY
ncbi:MAG: hypothetical protein ACC618_01100 [Patescibacteria group bacterium]